MRSSLSVMAVAATVFAFISQTCLLASGQVAGDVDSGVQTAQTELAAIWVGSIDDYHVPNLAGGWVVEIPPLPPGGQEFRLSLPLTDNKPEWLVLTPATVRDENYQLMVQRPDGTFAATTPGVERTYAGRVLGADGASVAASGVGGGMLASIFMPDGSSYWVQPLRDLVPGSPAALHVVYRGTDSACDGICGVTDDTDAAAPSGDGAAARGNCGAGVGPCLAQIAFDADWQYYNALGSVDAVEEQISATLNVVNHQYVREVSIQHRITTILVRTAEPDPYVSFDASTLLDQFTAEWENNQTGIIRDVAHLFTGRELNGSTIGIAWVSDICTNQSYSLTQPLYTTTFSCQTDLLAHELGHNWGASHCSCPSSTMNPFITCANTFLGAGSNSVASIVAYRDTRPCIGTVATPAPANNTCDNATIIRFNGSWTGSNVGATTDGGVINCGSDGGGQFDVFWQFTAPASGNVTLDTCGSNFDTILSVHSGCPAGPDNVIACNDDGPARTCADGTLQSALSFTASLSTTYFIRVSGFGSATGNITLHINAPGSATHSLCNNALEIFDGTALVSTLYGSGADGDASCGASSGNPDVWHVFNAACNGTLSVSTCGTDDIGGTDVGMDTVLSLHTACPGNTANQLTCNDDTVSANCPGNVGGELDSHVSTAVSAGSTTYVRVTHFGTRFRNGIYRLQCNFTPTLTAPVINAIPNATITAGLPYAGPTPSVTQACMLPVSWSLITGPAGMTIGSNGVVHWPNPVVAGSPHTVRIRASNAQGSDDEAWALTVIQGCPNPGGTGNHCSYDTNGDCQITLQDLANVLAAFGSSSGGPTYNPATDFDHDGDVDVQDLAFLLGQFGDLCN